MYNSRDISVLSLLAFFYLWRYVIMKVVKMNPFSLYFEIRCTEQKICSKISLPYLIDFDADTFLCVAVCTEWSPIILYFDKADRTKDLKQGKFLQFLIDFDPDTSLCVAVCTEWSPIINCFGQFDNLISDQCQKFSFQVHRCCSIQLLKKMPAMLLTFLFFSSNEQILWIRIV